MRPAIVLHASLRPWPGEPAWYAPLLRALPYARALELERRPEQQRHPSLSGLALALLAAERVAGRAFAPRAFEWSAAGRPRLRDGPSFSLSHCATRVACCAIAGADCGIDVEDVPADVDAATMARLQRWTATEAVLKALGLGLRAVDDVVIDDAIESGRAGAERFVLLPIVQLPGAVGHVAFRSTHLLQVTEVDLRADASLSAALERSLGLPLQVE
jgi:phosphopantetheinyl transferase